MSSPFADIPHLSSSSESVMTAAEYSASVASWLEQAYHLQMLAVGFPSYVAYQAYLSTQQQHQQQHQDSTPSGVHNDFQRRPAPRTTNINSNPAAADIQLHHFKIPPVWKRFVAEFIDFMALFVIKLIVTFVAVDTFGLIDLEEFMSRYDSSLVTLAQGKELDMTAALDLTSDIVFLEMIHRLVVCVFEAVCTFRGTAGSPGGATPGKLVMGLRIFKCDRLMVTNDPQYVQITPGTDLGVFWASVRACLKSFAIAFMFPVSITFFFLPYNRTLYDVMSHSIVVEVENPRNNLLRRNPR